MVRIGPMIALLALLALLGVLDGTVGLNLSGWVVGGCYGVLLNAVLATGLVRSGTPVMGPANLVTLSRAVLVGAVAALVADGLTGSAAIIPIVVLASVALSLDAVDGRIARRTGTVSPLGARFDMEVDAFLILVLSVHVAESVGRWVLAIGLARYALVAAARLLPWLREPSPPRYWCKVVATIQGIVLTVAVGDVLPEPVIVAVLAMALALLAESFGREVWWLWQNHRRDARPALEPVRPTWPVT